MGENKETKETKVKEEPKEAEVTEKVEETTKEAVVVTEEIKKELTVEPVKEDEIPATKKKKEDDELDLWKPKTKLGHMVKEGEITNIDEIIDNGLPILEPEIVESLLILESDLILIGQSKGKFGGGQRRVFKQTQKKTQEGNKPQFTTLAVVGDKNGHIGMGLGKAKETVPAREKAMRNAKKNIFKIRRGCGSWEGAQGHNSIPFKVSGKCGSVKITLIPAPKGKGLVTEKEVAKVLELAGIQDVLSKTFGHTENKINLIKALEDALRKLTKTRVNARANQNVKIFEGSVNEA